MVSSRSAFARALSLGEGDPFSPESSTNVSPADPDDTAFYAKFHIEGSEWQDDVAVTRCNECKTVFTVFVRKHHCRICGKVFCTRCSSNLIPNPQFGRSGGQKKLRCCNNCNSELHDESSERFANWILFKESLSAKLDTPTAAAVRRRKSTVFKETAKVELLYAWQREVDVDARARMGQGRLDIQILSASDLPIGDVSGDGGSSDPFVVCRVGSESVTSSTRYKTLNPVWIEEKLSLQHVLSLSRHLYISVFDEDAGGGSDFLCGVTIPLDVLADSNEHEGRWALTSDVDCLKGSATNSAADAVSPSRTAVFGDVPMHGSIRLRLSWRKLAVSPDKFSAWTVADLLSRVVDHIRPLIDFAEAFLALQEWTTAANSFFVLVLWILLCRNLWALPFLLHVLLALALLWEYVLHSYRKVPGLQHLVPGDDAEGSVEWESPKGLGKTKGLADRKVLSADFIAGLEGLTEKASESTQRQLLNLQERLNDTVRHLERIRGVLRWKNPSVTRDLLFAVCISALVHLFVPLTYTITGTAAFGIVAQLWPVGAIVSRVSRLVMPVLASRWALQSTAIPLDSDSKDDS